VTPAWLVTKYESGWSAPIILVGEATEKHSVALSCPTVLYPHDWLWVSQYPSYLVGEATEKHSVALSCPTVLYPHDWLWGSQ
jgi:hypothetical protein